MINHSNDYFNKLREKGIVVIQADTVWLDAFLYYVIENNLIHHKTLRAALDKTINVLKEGQTSTDAINLLKKFDIDYEPIEKLYQERLKEWEEILNDGKTKRII